MKKIESSVTIRTLHLNIELSSQELDLLRDALLAWTVDHKEARALFERIKFNTNELPFS